jgi:hypothetical protein
MPVETRSFGVSWGIGLEVGEGKVMSIKSERKVVTEGFDERAGVWRG